MAFLWEYHVRFVQWPMQRTVQGYLSDAPFRLVQIDEPERRNRLFLTMPNYRGKLRVQLNQLIPNGQITTPFWCPALFVTWTLYQAVISMHGFPVRSYIEFLSYAPDVRKNGRQKAEGRNDDYGVYDAGLSVVERGIPANCLQFGGCSDIGVSHQTGTDSTHSCIP